MYVPAFELTTDGVVKVLAVLAGIVLARTRVFRKFGFEVLLGLGLGFALVLIAIASLKG